MYGDGLVRVRINRRLFRRQRDRLCVLLGFQGRADLSTSDIGHITFLGIGALTDSHFSADGGNGCLKGVRAIQHDPLMLILDRGSIQLIADVQSRRIKLSCRHRECHAVARPIIYIVQGGVAVQGNALAWASYLILGLNGDLILQGHSILQALVRVIPGNSGTGEIGFAITSCDCYSIFAPHQTNLSAHRIGDEAFEVFADLPQSQIQLGFIIRIELVRIVTRQFVKTVVSESKSNSIDFAAHTAIFLACLKSSEFCQPFFKLKFFLIEIILCLLGITVVARSIADDDHDFVGIGVAILALKPPQSGLNSRRQICAVRGRIISIRFAGG